jgi:translation elongation factor EF-1beta/ribosomal protein L12E/L44/L45/RPP1/RPP2
MQLRELLERIQAVEAENKAIKALSDKLEARLVALEKSGVTVAQAAPAPVAAPAAAPATASAKKDDDFDLFDDDEEEDSAEKDRIKAERLAAYAAKKSTKTAVIAKSSILFDCKPWDDETDMVAMEAAVRKISMDGLLWNQNSKLVPVAYGVKKLQIGCVIEDDKVSTEVLEEMICGIEDYVQSVDIAAFNKI